jgi:hypothetical protein
MSFDAVWKYPVGTAAKVQVPKGGKVIHVGPDPTGVPCVWIEVDVGETVTEERTFAVFGTGHPLSKGWHHRGSFVDAPYVWHIYEAPLDNDGVDDAQA